MAETARPQLVVPRQVQTLELVRNMTGGFDVDVWHAMEARDNQLIVDEILHGAGSSAFVYRFDVQGKAVTGISVIGARHLAAHYKGLKHRLVSAEQKIGSLFVFKSYAAENMPMQVSCSVVEELKDEEDYYTAVCEVLDVKTGNTIQIERRESRFEERRGGGWFERPHYATIAQSKAYRNAVLSLVPQDIVIRWREEMLKLRKEEIITESVLEQKRTNVLHFAAQKAIALDRRAIEHLTLDQIAGLGDAAREGQLPAFVQAAQALGLDIAQGQAEGEPATQAAQQQPQRRQRFRPAPADQQRQQDLPTEARQSADRPRVEPGAGPREEKPSDAPPEGASGQQRRIRFEM